MAKEEFRLNPAQQQAVNITDGPVLVVAGAGTGKTRVIVERILRLIRDGIAPQAILALTFTEKAADEMRNRILSAQSSVSLETTVATFNGFGHELLNIYGAEWGLGEQRLLGETGQLVFLREHLDEFELDYFAPVSRPDSQLANLAAYVSQLKQQLVEPVAYHRYVKQLPAATAEEQLDKQKHRELAHFFEHYLELCRQENVIDYDDQLYLTIQLLRARPNVLRHLQQHYQYILVDEFQDTNPMQSQLIDMLAGNKQNIMVVGDDDQSIYGWRGATLANILDFKLRYPAAQEISLIENYRSTQAILDSAYQLIQHNNPNRLEVMNKLDKRLRAHSGPGKSPAVQHFATLDAELTWVAEDIARRLQNGQDASSIAVLARRTHGVQKMHERLELEGIAHAVAGLSSDLYEQPAVRQLLEALRLVADPLDELALYHVLTGPLFTLEAALLAEPSATARREHERLSKNLADIDNEPLQNALREVNAWREIAPDQTVGELAYRIITDSGWKERLYVQAEHDAELATQVQALSQFFDTLKEFERITQVPSVQSYMANLSTLKAAGSGFEDASLDISDTLVNVLSVHRAKGLEWDTVYIIDCTEGSFPMSKFSSSLRVPAELRMHETAADDQLAEERRLMYVAATRAKRELILSYADNHMSETKRRSSRFISELVGDQTAALHTVVAQTSLELFAPRQMKSIDVPAAILDSTGRLTLNVSQIDCYLRCPQDFYYLYIEQVPVPVDPAQQYGTAIHAIIEQILSGRLRGKPPRLADLLQSLEQALPRAGYLTPKSRERAHEQARQTVEAIYSRFIKAPLPIESEKPFNVYLQALQLKMTGRIDAIYQLEKGIEIRDFKTGTTVKTPQQAKARATSSNQLTLYALAWRELHQEMPALLSLDFVETGQVGSVKKKPQSLDTMLTKLASMVTNLRTGNYPAGKDHTYCQHPL